MDAITDDEADAAVRAFAKWMQQDHIAQRSACRVIGCHTSTLSRLLKGERPARWKHVALNMATAVARHRLRDDGPQRPTFAKTRAAVEIIGALNDAHSHCWSVLVIGDSGVGKNWAVSQYTQKTKGCVRLRCVPNGGSRALANQVARELDVRHDRGRNIPDVLAECADELANTGQLLIVEECDWLTECCAQTVRTLVDMTDPTGADVATVGCAYIGTPSFLANVERWSSSTADQFHDRIAEVVQVSGPTRGDVRAVVGNHEIESNAVDAAFTGCHGSLRRLANAAMLARRLSAGAALTARHFDVAYAQLLTPTNGKRSVRDGRE